MLSAIKSLLLPTMSISTYKLLTAFLISFLFGYSGYAQQTQVLLVGTFHFDNPGLDAAKLKSLDIKSVPVQKEINNIVAAIAKYHPQQIFVEYPYQDQDQLNDLYKIFLADSVISGIRDKSELYQIGFKSAKALGLKQLDAMDYKMNLTGTDSMMKVMKGAGQEEFMRAIPEYIKTISGNFNQLVQSGASLTDIIIAQNTPAYRSSDLGFYTNLLTKAGESNNFTGANIAVQWYERNICMFSLFQKKLKPESQKVMVILGASHIAALQTFFKLNPAYQLVELKDILNK